MGAVECENLIVYKGRAILSTEQMKKYFFKHFGSSSQLKKFFSIHIFKRLDFFIAFSKVTNSYPPPPKRKNI